jgi:SanA protein
MPYTTLPNRLTAVGMAACRNAMAPIYLRSYCTREPRDTLPLMGKRSHKHRIVFWSIIAAALLVVLAGVFTLTANLVITTGARDYIVQTAEEAPHAQCAIILGARIHDDGTPYPMLADRLQTGVELYRLGKVDKLLVSGDNSKPAPYKETDLMLAYALQQGVPEDDIFTDYAGYDTYETMRRAKDVFQVQTALVVTQDFHLSRAVDLARHLGLEATGVVADIQPYADEGANAAREVLARVKAVLHLYLEKHGPTGAEGPYPITGDGRTSRQ